ncbi:MAG TPA: hypothetical protein VF069_01995 [Streptosporangiaceae bacterium]
MRRTRHRAISLLGSAAPAGALLVAVPGLPAPTPKPSPAAAADFQPLPAPPVNACANSGLPRGFGTHFPTPVDPFGFGPDRQP